MTGDGMNHIDVIERKNKQGSLIDFDVAVDGKALPKLLDFLTNNSPDEKLNSFLKPFSDLMPAWSYDIDFEGDIRFVWNVLNMDKAPVPLFLCEEDADFSCIVIVVDVEKTEDFVYWNRIGYVNHDNENLDDEIRRGILYTETYTDEDWEKYGDNIALEEIGSDKWHKWIGENWSEELFRRRINYTLPYYKAEGNVTWFLETDWEFDRLEYDSMLKKYLTMQRLKRADYYLNTSKDKMTPTVFAKVAASFLPDGEKILEEHYKDYGEVLLHVLASEAITEPFIDLVKDKRSSDHELDLYLKALKLMLQNGDEDVLNALNVTVYERLCDEKEAFLKRGINIAALIP